MIRKAEWQTIYDELVAAHGEQTPPPPTVDEMFAYIEGRLSKVDEERVRNLLVCHPDLARALVTTIPEDDASELSDADVERQWNALQPRIDRSDDNVVQFWRVFGAIAAALAVVAAGFLWRAESELRRPRVAPEQQLLLPDGQRGNGDASAVISSDGESFLLIAPLINEQPFNVYQLEINDVATSPVRSLWTSGPLHRPANDAFAVLVPRSFLAPGRYQLVLYGVDGSRRQLLTTFTLRVPSAQGAAASPVPRET